MWGYVAVGGFGLLGILGFAIWALVERSKRKDAELGRRDQEILRDKAERIASTNAAVVAEVRAQLQRSREETGVLAQRLIELRKRLEACADPQEVKEWLDELGKGGPV